MIDWGRHIVGFVLVIVAQMMTDAATGLLRLGAWLMDQEDVLAEPTRRDLD